MSSSSLQFPTPAANDEATATGPQPPPEFLCPITLDLMRDPVAGRTGVTYDRPAVEAWLRAGGRRTCPVTKGELRAEDLVPNHTLRRLIHAWCAANLSAGGSAADRGAPAAEVADAVAKVERAARAGDADCCAAAARVVRRLAREADGNRRRCLSSAGAAHALAAAFTSFARATDAAAAAACDAVLAALVLVTPMDEEAIVAVGASGASVARLLAVAANGYPRRRLQAVVVLREIVALSCHRLGSGAIDLSANTEAIAEVLVRAIRDATVCPQATRACLVAAYHLAACSDNAGASAARLVAAGLVPALVELLVDADRSTAEKALAALDAALASGDGRARARADALAVPVLVGSMFRVSDTATDLVVSALLRICKKQPEDDGDRVARRHAIVEALQVGALQKVLLLLQVGCREETRAKATELLRLMVRYHARGECIDAMDFRGLNNRDDTAILID